MHNHRQNHLHRSLLICLLLVTVFFTLSGCALAAQAARDPAQIIQVYFSGPGGPGKLAAALGVSAAQVQLVSTDEAQWPNACLGMTSPGQACADEVTPGWRLVFNVNGQQYEVRTDDSGSSFRLAPKAG